KHRIEHLKLTARVLSVKGDRVRARLDGTLKLKHTFYPGRDDNNRAEATVAGYLDFDRTTGRVLGLRLITERATYGRFGFTVALRSVPCGAPRTGLQTRPAGFSAPLGKSLIRRLDLCILEPVREDWEGDSAASFCHRGRMVWRRK